MTLPVCDIFLRSIVLRQRHRTLRVRRVEHYVGAAEMNLRCCCASEHEPYELVADRRRARSRGRSPAPVEDAFFVACIDFVACTGPETVARAAATANLSAHASPAKRSLRAAENKAGFVSLTEPRSLLRFTTSKRGRSPCRNPIPIALPAKPFA
jgi:hypothetical protein